MSRIGTETEVVSIKTISHLRLFRKWIQGGGHGNRTRNPLRGTTFPVQQGRPVGVPSMFRQRKTSGKPPFPQAAVGVPSAAVRRSLQQSVQHRLLCDKYGGQSRDIMADPLGPHPGQRFGPTPSVAHERVGRIYKPLPREQKSASQWAICYQRNWCISRASQVLKMCMKRSFPVPHNGQSASMAGLGFSTSRQHPTIGETNVMPLLEAVFLVVRSRKHRMGGRGAQYISLRDNREKNHAQRFSRTSMFADHAAGITAGCDRAP